MLSLLLRDGFREGIHKVSKVVSRIVSRSCAPLALGNLAYRHDSRSNVECVEFRCEYLGTF